MGNKSSRPVQPINSIEPMDQSKMTSQFYLACRDGNLFLVQQLLPSMSIEEINRFESNGSTALHVASYYGHGDIVQLLLDFGACRTLKNLQYQLTPIEEARNEEIRQLFLHSHPRPRFLGLSPKIEWSFEISQTRKFQTSLTEFFQSDLSFQEKILFLIYFYLNEYVQLPIKDFDRIRSFFYFACKNDDATYIVQALTSTTQFYAIVNSHLTEYLLKCFRSNLNFSRLERSVIYFASIFLQREELKSKSFVGKVYRGVLLLQSDLKLFTVDQRLLNKSFLFTSKDCSEESIYKGIGDRTKTKTSIDKNPMQYIVLCIYHIKNATSALDITTISEISSEEEVLIMPLCTFQIQSIRKCHDKLNHEVRIEIEFEECEESVLLRKTSADKLNRPRVT